MLPLAMKLTCGGKLVDQDVNTPMHGVSISFMQLIAGFIHSSTYCIKNIGPYPQDPTQTFARYANSQGDVLRRFWWDGLVLASSRILHQTRWV